jgi:hypothetical protein
MAERSTVSQIENTNFMDYVISKLATNSFNTIGIVDRLVV